jgi:hypothetical protein
MTGYGDELVGHLADRMNSTNTGRVPIIERGSGRLVRWWRGATCGASARR